MFVVKAHLVAGYRFTMAIEDDKTRTRCSLVNATDKPLLLLFNVRFCNALWQPILLLGRHVGFTRGI